MASSAQTSAETEIKNLVSGSFDQIWSAYSIKDIDKYYTNDFLLLEHGEVWNRDSIAKIFEKVRALGPIPKRENKFEFIEIKIEGKMAWIAFHNYAEFTVDGKLTRKAHWLESATAILTDKGWRLQMLHSTRVSNEKY